MSKLNKILISIILIFQLFIVNAMASISEHEFLRAAAMGNIRKVMAYVEAGNDINIQSKDGSTALIFATLYYRVVVADYLVQNNADINVINQDGESAIKLAVKEPKRFSILTLFFSRPNSEIIMVDSHGNTPLHIAIITNNNKAAEFLIKKGIFNNTKNIVGNTPLHRAISLQNQYVIKLLISNQASLEIKNNDEFTPLGWAVNFYQDELVKILLEAGADANARTKNNRTLFHYLIKLVDSSIKDKQCTCHLCMINFKRDNPELRAKCWSLINLLLANGSDQNIKDHKNETPAEMTDIREIKELINRSNFMNLGKR